MSMSPATGEEIRGTVDQFGVSLGKKISKTTSQSISQAWWCAPVISAIGQVIGRRIPI
jgi:hypothetical protein